MPTRVIVALVVIVTDLALPFIRHTGVIKIPRLKVTFQPDCYF